MDKTFNDALILGFDRVMGELASRANSSRSNYPPHNIFKFKNGSYVIQLALAGYKKEDLHIEHDVQDSVLTVRSDKSAAETFSKDIEVANHGISARKFVKTFTISPELRVSTAKMEDGLLTLHLDPIERKVDKIKIEL